MAQVLCLLLGFGAVTALAQSAETIAEVRVHGNYLTSSDEVVTLSGVKVGTPFTASTLRDTEARLRSSGKFDDVQVLKRFASITDPNQITLVIIVNEGPVRVEFERSGDEDVARLVRRGWFSELMFLPILDGEDGYGLTYGLTTSRANVFGDRSRVAVPLSWGGTKRAALEIEKNFVAGPLTRLEVGGAFQRKRNPAFDIEDHRKKAWIRAERAFDRVRLGATGGWDRVRFDALEEDFYTVGADVTFDTRIDQGFPRNAVLATASWERLQFSTSEVIHRTRLEGRGYIGLIGQTVLAVRAFRDGASGAQRQYLQPILGGWSTLRGFEAGQFHGDIVVAGSAELLVPLTTPLNAGRLGVSGFVDTGVAYAHGLKFSDQPRKTGVGASVWFVGLGFKLSLSVAHGRGDKTRFNFGGGFTF